MQCGGVCSEEQARRLVGLLGGDASVAECERALREVFETAPANEAVSAVKCVRGFLRTPQRTGDRLIDYVGRDRAASQSYGEWYTTQTNEAVRNAVAAFMQLQPGDVKNYAAVVEGALNLTRPLVPPEQASVLPVPLAQQQEIQRLAVQQAGQQARQQAEQFCQQHTAQVQQQMQQQMQQFQQQVQQSEVQRGNGAGGAPPGAGAGPEDANTVAAQIVQEMAAMVRERYAEIQQSVPGTALYEVTYNIVRLRTSIEASTVITDDRKPLISSLDASITSAYGAATAYLQTLGENIRSLTATMQAQARKLDNAELATSTRDRYKEVVPESLDTGASWPGVTPGFTKALFATETLMRTGATAVAAVSVTLQAEAGKQIAGASAEIDAINTARGAVQRARMTINAILSVPEQPPHGLAFAIVPHLQALRAILPGVATAANTKPHADVTNERDALAKSTRDIYRTRTAAWLDVMVANARRAINRSTTADEVDSAIVVATEAIKSTTDADEAMGVAGNTSGMDTKLRDLQKSAAAKKKQLGAPTGTTDGDPATMSDEQWAGLGVEIGTITQKAGRLEADAKVLASGLLAGGDPEFARQVALVRSGASAIQGAIRETLENIEGAKNVSQREKQSAADRLLGIVKLVTTADKQAEVAESAAELDALTKRTEALALTEKIADLERKEAAMAARRQGAGEIDALKESAAALKQQALAERARAAEEKAQRDLRTAQQQRETDAMLAATRYAASEAASKARIADTTDTEEAGRGRFMAAQITTLNQNFTRVYGGERQMTPFINKFNLLLVSLVGAAATGAWTETERAVNVGANGAGPIDDADLSTLGKLLPAIVTFINQTTQAAQQYRTRSAIAILWLLRRVYKADKNKDAGQTFAGIITEFPYSKLQRTGVIFKPVASSEEVEVGTESDDDDVRTDDAQRASEGRGRPRRAQISRGGFSKRRKRIVRETWPQIACGDGVPALGGFAEWLTEIIRITNTEEFDNVSPKELAKAEARRVVSGRVADTAPEHDQSADAASSQDSTPQQDLTLLEAVDELLRSDDADAIIRFTVTECDEPSSSIRAVAAYVDGNDRIKHRAVDVCIAMLTILNDRDDDALVAPALGRWLTDTRFCDYDSATRERSVGAPPEPVEHSTPEVDTDNAVTRDPGPLVPAEPLGSHRGVDTVASPRQTDTHVECAMDARDRHGHSSAVYLARVSAFIESFKLTEATTRAIGIDAALQNASSTETTTYEGAVRVLENGAASLGAGVTHTGMDSRVAAAAACMSSLWLFLHTGDRSTAIHWLGRAVTVYNETAPDTIHPVDTDGGLDAQFLLVEHALHRSEAT